MSKRPDKKAKKQNLLILAVSALLLLVVLTCCCCGYSLTGLPAPDGPATTEVPADTPRPTETLRPANTPRPTNTPYPTAVPTPTDTPCPMQAPVPTATQAPTPIPAPTQVPATAIPQPTSPPVEPCVITAWVDNEAPTQNQHVHVYGTLFCGEPVAGAPMHVVWHYKSTTSTCDGITDASGTAVCERGIGRASSGYYVQLDVTITHGGQSYRASTGFTPQ